MLFGNERTQENVMKALVPKKEENGVCSCQVSVAAWGDCRAKRSPLREPIMIQNSFCLYNRSISPSVTLGRRLIFLIGLCGLCSLGILKIVVEF